MARHAEGFIEGRVKQTGGKTQRIGTNDLIRSITRRDCIIGLLSKRSIRSSILESRRVANTIKAVCKLNLKKA